MPKHSTTADFKKKACTIHGDTYTYDNAVYVNSCTKLTITCREHGNFEVTPNNHLAGGGCSACSNRQLTTAEFKARARTVHGDTYTYDKAAYRTTKTKLTITCREHGDFEQQPDNHLQGQGCPACFPGGFDYSKPGLVYYLRVDRPQGKPVYKIGITNRTIEARFTGADRDKITTLQTWHFDDGRDAWDFEQHILHRYASDAYTGEPVLTRGGNTELFRRDVLGLCDLYPGWKDLFQDETLEAAA